jgi:hypothetical protein
MRRRTAATVLVLLAVVVAGCSGSEEHFHVDIALVGTQPLPLKVPPVEPGEYRIVKEVSQERPVVRRRVVLYGRLRVVH